MNYNIYINTKIGLIHCLSHSEWFCICIMHSACYQGINSKFVSKITLSCSSIQGPKYTFPVASETKIQYWRPEFHSWLPAGDLSCGLSHSKKMINIWNHKDICQQVSYMYFLSSWYSLIKSETNLPVKIPPQQLLSIRVESFQVAMVLSAEIW